MYPVELRGERIFLRELSPDDLAAIRVYAEDDEVHRYTLWQRDQEADTVEWLKRMDEAARAPERVNYTLAVCDASEQLIGGAGITIVTPHRGGSIGYAIRRDRWNRGLTTEAARLLVDFGFGKLRLHRISAECHPDNVGSWRVMEKAGMQREGLQRKKHLIRDEWQDAVLYSILEDEWRASVTR